MKDRNEHRDRLREAQESTIRELADLLGSQIAIADAAGITQSTLSKAACGHTILSGESLLALSDLALEHGVDYIAVEFCGADYAPVPLPWRSTDGSMDDEIVGITHAMSQAGLAFDLDPVESRRFAQKAAGLASAAIREAQRRLISSPRLAR